ncbi:MAG: hypothetical protein ACKVUS_18640 [Saprospiraceae bacterium]
MIDSQVLENEQVILDAQGKPAYVVVPVERYKKLLEALEDFGLGEAILEAEQDPRLSRMEALAVLEADEMEMH